MTRIGQLYDGDSFAPTLKDFLLVCCDCGLAHRLDFEVGKLINKNKYTPIANKDAVIVITMTRDETVTRTIRRKKDD